MKKVTKLVALLAVSTLVACDSAKSITYEEACEKANTIAAAQEEMNYTDSSFTASQTGVMSMNGVDLENESCTISYNKSLNLAYYEASYKTPKDEEGKEYETETVKAYIWVEAGEDSAYTVYIANDDGRNKLYTTETFTLNAESEYASVEDYMEEMIEEVIYELPFTDIFGTDVLEEFADAMSEDAFKETLNELISEGAEVKSSIKYTSSGDGNLGVSAVLSAKVEQAITEDLTIKASASLSEKLEWNKNYLSEIDISMKTEAVYPESELLGDYSGMKATLDVSEKGSVKLSSNASKPDLSGYTKTDL